jgi:hypothetical protein
MGYAAGLLRNLYSTRESGCLALGNFRIVLLLIFMPQTPNLDEELKNSLTLQPEGVQKHPMSGFFLSCDGRAAQNRL